MKHNAFALLAALAVVGCSSSINEPIGGPAAVLTVVFPSHPADTLKVFVTDTATITAAEAFVATRSGPHMLTGRIVKGAGFDARYPFHYKPETVRLADVAIEICDGEPMRTSAAVNQFFEWSTGSANSDSAPWCPWESKPIAVQRILPD